MSRQPKGIKCSERALSNKGHLWKTRLERACREVETGNEFMRLRTEMTGLGWRGRKTRVRASEGANDGFKGSNLIWYSGKCHRA